MHKYVNIGKFSLLLFLCIALSGCAVFRGGNVPETVLPLADNTVLVKPSISYSITAMGGFSGASTAPDSVQNIIAGELLQTLEQSEYFGRISKNDAEADLELAVQVKNTGDPMAMLPAVITGLSLYLIPSWATDNFAVTAVVKNRQGKSQQYTREDSTTLFQWLPMMFVFPAKNFSVIPEVRKNIYRNILVQMKKDGFIENRPQ